VKAGELCLTDKNASLRLVVAQRSIINLTPTREEQETLLREAGLKGAINRELIGEGFTVLTVQR
jgi:hypothetical protein